MALELANLIGAGHFQHADRILGALARQQRTFGGEGEGAAGHRSGDAGKAAAGEDHADGRSGLAGGRGLAQLSSLLAAGDFP